MVVQVVHLRCDSHVYTDRLRAATTKVAVLVQKGDQGALRWQAYQDFVVPMAGYLGIGTAA